MQPGFLNPTRKRARTAADTQKEEEEPETTETPEQQTPTTSEVPVAPTYEQSIRDLSTKVENLTEIVLEVKKQLQSMTNRLWPPVGAVEQIDLTEEQHSDANRSENPEDPESRNKRTRRSSEQSPPSGASSSSRENSPNGVGLLNFLTGLRSGHDMGRLPGEGGSGTMFVSAIIGPRTFRNPEHISRRRTEHEREVANASQKRIWAINVLTDQTDIDSKHEKGSPKPALPTDAPNEDDFDVKILGGDVLLEKDQTVSSTGYRSIGKIEFEAAASSSLSIIVALKKAISHDINVDFLEQRIFTLPQASATGAPNNHPDDMKELQQLLENSPNGSEPPAILLRKRHRNTYHISVKSVDGESINVMVDPTDFVWELKYLISEARNTQCESQRLIFRGQLLENSRTLSSYSVRKDNTVHLVLQN